MGLLVNIDNGGTLTDVCAFDGKRIVHAKTLTTPHDLTECLINGLAALGEQLGYGDDMVGLVSAIDHLRYSTTQGTNAIVQRKGPRLGLILSDAQEERALKEASPELFDALVGDRVALMNGADVAGTIQAVRSLISQGASRLVICLSGEDAAAIESELRRILYDAFPRHLLGAVPLLFSTDLAPGVDVLRRAWSSLLNAFLHPSMEQFLHHAEDKLRREKSRNPLLIFRNDGGSTRVARTVALHTYSSGPRGGAEGAAKLASHYGIGNFASLDIGGTTTDLALFQHGAVAEHGQGSVEGTPIAFPLADIPSVAAGGGSILSVKDGAIQVGPESMGALPGPACFGRGGTQATLTDAMLVLEVLDPDSYFGGSLKLDRDRAENAIQTNLADPLGMGVLEASRAAIDAFDAKVANAIGELGADGPLEAMLAFGGAGPMSACGIAEKAGIDKVLVPRFAAVFSAFGIGFSPVRHHHSSTVDSWTSDAAEEAKAGLLARAERAMESEGFVLSDCTLRWEAKLSDGSAVEPDDVRDGQAVLLNLEATRPLPTIGLDDLDAALAEADAAGNRGSASPLPLYRLEDLVPGQGASGPALVEEQFFTAWVREGWRFSVTGNHDLLLTREGN